MFLQIPDVNIAYGNVNDVTQGVHDHPWIINRTAAAAVPQRMF